MDFTIRQKQFFDHYPMDKPAPSWMAVGKSQKNNLGKDPYELMPTRITPGPGLAMDTIPVR